MSFFTRKKKTSACSCQNGCACGEPAKGMDSGCFDAIRSIKVLGMGCKSCHEQYEKAKQAIQRMGLTIDVEYITDLEQVASYGAMSMPAVVVNDQVIAMGKVLSAEDLETMLHKLCASDER